MFSHLVGVVVEEGLHKVSQFKVFSESDDFAAIVRTMATLASRADGVTLSEKAVIAWSVAAMTSAARDLDARINETAPELCL